MISNVSYCKFKINVNYCQ